KRVNAIRSFGRLISASRLPNSDNIERRLVLEASSSMSPRRGSMAGVKQLLRTSEADDRSPQTPDRLQRHGRAPGDSRAFESCLATPTFPLETRYSPRGVGAIKAASMGTPSTLGLMKETHHDHATRSRRPGDARCHARDRQAAFALVPRARRPDDPRRYPG